MNVSSPLSPTLCGSKRALYLHHIQRSLGAYIRGQKIRLLKGPATLFRRHSSLRAGILPTGQTSSRSYVTQAVLRGGQKPVSLQLRQSSTMADKEPKPDQSQKRKQKPPPSEPRPSASILLLSPTNQILLLHRVHTSSAFPSAHVFPGGNLSTFHDGEVPPPGDPTRHEDSRAYRLAAIRETFEESGILLARDARVAGSSPPLLNLPAEERNAARKTVHGNETRFIEWVEGAGGVVDVDGLVPFTRWITPEATPRRFTTQMYLYMLPVSTPSTRPDRKPAIAIAAAAESDPQKEEALIPTPDGGVEHTTARFDNAPTWLERQRRGEITLFPPQCFLLHLVSQFLVGPHNASSTASEPHGPPATATAAHYEAQRERLLAFIHAVPTAPERQGKQSHPTARIPWPRKVMSPVTLGVRLSDRRAILGIDKPGPELKDTGRGGDHERVVLARFNKHGVSEVEVRNREEVLEEEREAQRTAHGPPKL